MDNMNELLKKLLQYLEQTENFVAEQAPDIIQQFLSFQAWEAKMYFVIWTVVTITLIIAVLLGVFWMIKKRAESFDVFMTLLTTSALVSVVSIGIWCNLAKLKKIELAPKVVALEYVREQLGGK